MADIQELLTNIQNAKYGREVRGSIYQALSAMNDQVENAFVSNERLTSSHDLNTMYAMGRWWYTRLSDGVPQNYPFDSGKYGTIVVFGGASQLAEGKAQIVITNDGEMAYRAGAQSGWGDWHFVPKDEDLITFDETIYTAARFAAAGYTKIADMPSNQVYRFGTNLENIGLPKDNTAATMAIIQDGTGVRFYVCAQSGQLFYRYRWGDEDSKWLKFALTKETGDFLKTEPTLIHPSSGWNNVDELPPNALYRLASDLGRFGLPVENTGGATCIVMQGASGGVKLYLCAQSGSLYYRYKSSTGASAWMNLTSGGGGSSLPTKVYVALGASTTVGSLDSDGPRSPYVYPYYIGAMGNFEVHNLAVGGTDFMRRSGGLNNIMDVITDPANAEVLRSADLITVSIGGNDSKLNYEEIYNTTLTDAEKKQKIIEHTGNPTDYYVYNRTTEATNYNYPSSDSRHWTMYRNCTKTGAGNFIIQYLAEHFPKAQIIFLYLPWTARQRAMFDEVVSDSGITGKKVTFAKNSSYIIANGKTYNEIVKEKFDELCAAAMVPIADAGHMFMTAFTDPEEKLGSNGTHPLYDAYEQYSKAVAAKVLALYRN